MKFLFLFHIDLKKEKRKKEGFLNLAGCQLLLKKQPICTRGSAGLCSSQPSATAPAPPADGLIFLALFLFARFSEEILACSYLSSSLRNKQQKYTNLRFHFNLESLML